MRISRLGIGMRMFLRFWGMVSSRNTNIERLVLTFCFTGFDTREFDGRDITHYLGLLEDGKDVQPKYGDELLNKLAGWAVGK